LDQFPVLINITGTRALPFPPSVSRPPRCAQFAERLTFKNASVHGLPKGFKPRGALLAGNEILGDAFADLAHHFCSRAQVE
jgi:hypothetical protein